MNAGQAPPPWHAPRVQSGHTNYGYGGPSQGPPPQFSQQSPPPRRRKSGATIYGIIIATIAIGFVGGVALLVFFLTRPRGEKIGDTNLLDPRAAIAVDAAAGDALFFRVDMSVAVPVIDLMDDNQRERQIERQLRTSTLSIRAKSPAGQERVSTCPVYNGKAGSVSTIGGSHSRAGLLNACTVAIDTPGTWTVQGAVSWSSGFAPTKASLETRLEKPKK